MWILQWKLCQSILEFINKLAGVFSVTTIWSLVLSQFTTGSNLAYYTGPRCQWHVHPSPRCRDRIFGLVQRNELLLVLLRGVVSGTVRPQVNFDVKANANKLWFHFRWCIWRSQCYQVAAASVAWPGDYCIQRGQPQPARRLSGQGQGAQWYSGYIWKVINYIGKRFGEYKRRSRWAQSRVRNIIILLLLIVYAKENCFRILSICTRVCTCFICSGVSESPVFKVHSHYAACTKGNDRSRETDTQWHFYYSMINSFLIDWITFTKN